ncbi:ankyrin repeat domain-containing protein [Endozoicomonas sp. SCSIO W0465]|uniref:ankyrin repeat domain-containing protein n=1 Tax=Endozoicomonas sp. SCSIO W0465 TaxID=2918516 RepID=UPI002075D3DF|nr:ankyrin repeat domain-containing protein [Endozoicomonas sp. SCSIO W0465]USE34557.1 ankyrin repeat domain-containing protein [Endozoicomonas sp. SCSIO W0465]
MNIERSATVTSTTNAGVSGDQPTTDEQSQMVAMGRRCSSWQHAINRVTLHTKGWKSALIRAAKTGDVEVITHIANFISPNTEIRSKSKNQTPLMKALKHNQPQALEALLNFGASTDDICHFVHPNRFSFSKGKFRLISELPIGYCTEQTLKILLHFEKIDPNEDLFLPNAKYSSNMTLVEYRNMEARSSSERSEMCLMLIKDRRANVNMSTYFDFNCSVKAMDSYPSVLSHRMATETFEDRNRIIRISLLGQAILFNNKALIEHLLSDHRLDPGAPGSDEAENLLTIVCNKLSQGLANTFKETLLEKICESELFCQHLRQSENSAFKENFLSLYYSVNSWIAERPHYHGPDDIDALNDKVEEVIFRVSTGAPPSYEEVLASRT